MSLSRLTLLAVLAAACACNSGDAEETAGSNAPVAPSTLSPVRFDRSAYCKKVLPVSAVAKYFPGDELSARAKLLAPARLAECMYRSKQKVTPEHGAPHPRVEIKLRVDCRGLESNVARTRRLVKAALGGKKSSFRKVDYGRGGGYIRGTVRLGKSGGAIYHQVRVLHDSLPCSFTVLEVFDEEDKTELLARLLLERINKDALPQ
jgi:hypothetical protein